MLHFPPRHYPDLERLPTLPTKDSPTGVDKAVAPADLSPTSVSDAADPSGVGVFLYGSTDVLVTLRDYRLYHRCRPKPANPRSQKRYPVSPTL
jgi:hypothetical protein